MISKGKPVMIGDEYYDVRCLSTDVKPTKQIKNGSLLIEIDTGKRYLFDYEQKAWNEVPFDSGAAPATTSTAGIVKPDGKTIDVSQDGTISIATEGDGAIRSVTAEGWAEQDGTPSPDYPQEIQVVRGHEVTGKTGRFVDLEVRDANDQLLSTIPIPLPSKGYAASLPDGTHDTLTIDGAGHVEWESATNEATFNGSEAWAIQNNGKRIRTTALVGLIRGCESNSTVYAGVSSHFPALTPNDTWAGSLVGFSADIMTSAAVGPIFSDGTGAMTVASWTAWLASNPVTVLYPLASPTTEDMGYVTLPITTEGDTVTIPELEDVAVVRWADTVATEIARQWYERASAVESRVATIESDLAETITDAATTRAGLATVASDLGSLVLEVGSNASRIAESERRIDSMRRGLLRRDGDWYDNASITAFLAARFDGKLYGYLEPKTTATEVAKTGANAGMPNPTLGTALVAGFSKYRDIGPFQWFAAKGVVDSDGVPHMRVIRGIDSEDAWDACTDNVWAIHPVVWYDVDDAGDAVIGSVSDTWHQGLKPNPQASLPDGTLRPYMVRPRYALGLENGVCVSKSGLMGYSHTFDATHNGLISNIGYATSGYGGKSIYDQWYDAFFSRMIYGTKDFQTVMMGCVSYNYQYNPAVAETGTDRVVLTNAQAANLVVGSSMMLGTRLGAQDNDRARTQNYDVFDGLRIESIEEYDSTRMAVTFDATFDTATTHLLSTAPWHSGSCDAMDWDGSPANPLSGREPAFFQGAEILAGTYETLAGVILSNDGSGCVPYVTHDTRDDATSVTEDFTALDALPTNDTDGWKYPLYISDHGGLMYGTTTGASATSGASDGHYTNKSSMVGTRQWLSGGSFGYGRDAGPSCVYGASGLGRRLWDIWSRLSGTGRSRG